MLNIDRRVRSLLASEAERTIDAALASGLVESVARSVVENHVAERVGNELLPPERESEALLVAERTVEAMVRSPGFRVAVADLVASEEVRRGLQETGIGFGAELTEALRSRVDAADDALQTRLRRRLRLRPAPALSKYGGAIGRAVAFVLDLALVQTAVTIGAASVALVLSLVDVDRTGAAVTALGSIGWLLVVAVYFASFWSFVGQTPGMRLLGLRVATTDDELPSLPRSFARFAGLLVAILVAFLGLLPVLVDGRRRGLHDFAAGTVVFRYDD
jgi:uncharacterized RDD family membrane protein YckC